MFAKEIKEVIKEYLTYDKTEYAIMKFFTADKEKIIELRNKLNEWVPAGINKPEALRRLKEYLDDIIKRLEKEIEYIRI